MNNLFLPSCEPQSGGPALCAVILISFENAKRFQKAKRRCGQSRVPAETRRKRFRWETEEQGSRRSFCRKAETERSGLCDDEVQMPTEAFLAVLKLDE